MFSFFFWFQEQIIYISKLKLDFKYFSIIFTKKTNIKQEKIDKKQLIKRLDLIIKRDLPGRNSYPFNFVFSFNRS